LEKFGITKKLVVDSKQVFEGPGSKGLVLRESSVRQINRKKSVVLFIGWVDES